MEQRKKVGHLYKREANLQRFVVRRYYLSGQMLSYYKVQSGTPSGVTFLPGFYVKQINDDEVLYQLTNLFFFIPKKLLLVNDIQVT